MKRRSIGTETTLTGVSKDILRFDTPVKGEKELRSGFLFSHEEKRKKIKTFQIKANKSNGYIPTNT